MRPPDHMPADPDDATVATLGDVKFIRNWAKTIWIDQDNLHQQIQYDAFTRYGASFWKKVPTPPGGTRELTEEEWKAKTFVGWILRDDGSWVRGKWDTDGMPQDEPWRCRVPIEKKVVAWPEPNPQYAYFDTEELRDRAVIEANERANGREL